MSVGFEVTRRVSDSREGNQVRSTSRHVKGLGDSVWMRRRTCNMVDGLAVKNDLIRQETSVLHLCGQAVMGESSRGTQDLAHSLTVHRDVLESGSRDPEPGLRCHLQLPGEESRGKLPIREDEDSLHSSSLSRYNETGRLLPPSLYDRDTEFPSSFKPPTASLAV